MNLVIEVPGETAALSDPDWLRRRAVEAVGQPRLAGPLCLFVDIVVAMPAAWPQHKRALALIGGIRPKIGRLTDALPLAALNQIVWRDKSQIVEMHTARFYGPRPRARILVTAA